MNPIDILGGLLGHKSGRSSGTSRTSSEAGTDIFSDVFGGGARREKSPAPKDLESQAKELEDLLNVSRDSYRQRSQPPARSAPPERAPSNTPTSVSPSSYDDRALILMRAMINAAKSDGQLDADEQQAILQRFSGNSAEAVQFLRSEFQEPLNVAGFAASVPVGMEQQVYAMSLMTIKLDSGKEAQYLLDLSQALRLSDSVRDQIHEHYGAPSIF